MSDSEFMRPRALAAIVASMAIAFALSMLLTLKGSDQVDESVGANSFSRSAIGHRGFYELLQKLGYSVSRDYGDATEKLKGDPVLVLSEPFADPKTLVSLKQLEEARTVLLVLPKWRAWRDFEHKGWAGGVTPVFKDDVNSVLATVGRGEIARVAQPAPFESDLIDWTPTISGEAQLIVNSDLEPVVASADGVLLGKRRRGQKRLFVLSDPDVLANQGIGKGDNAYLVEGVMPFLGGARARIVFNEAIHGETGDPRAPPPDLLKLLARFPYPLAAAQLLLGLLLLFSATIGRFGAPQPAPKPLSAGKRGLIANTARLLDYAGHRTSVLRRYVEVTIRDTARRLKAPKQLDETALISWLQRLGRARGVKSDCGAILADAARAIASDRQTPFAAARAIHAWKMEILDGHSEHRRDR